MARARSVTRTLNLMVVMGVAVLAMSSRGVPLSGASSGYDVTYTVDADFDQGTLFNVNHDASGSNQLQLNTELTTFPIMWIANAGEDTLSKVDTNTGRELARYFTYAPRFNHINNAYAGPAPSRTAVDSNGNAYVANRHFDGQRPSVMKVLAETYIDRNGNGVLDTSTDANSDGIIQPGEMLPMTDANGNGRPDSDGDGNGLPDALEIQDERIAWIQPVGPANGLGRSLCLDTNENLWVGMFNTGQYFKMGSSDGAILAGPVATPSHNPYGCVVDSSGMLWSASLGNTLGQLNTNANTWVNTHFHNRGDYGIAIGNGVVYQSDGGVAYKYFTPGPNTFSLGGPGSSTGIAVDSSGNILAGEFGGPVRKFNSSNALVWSASAAGGTFGSHGTIVDSNNDVWRINLSSHNMTKYNGVTGALIGVFPIGNSPYTYSDATGLSARNNTTPSGTWTVQQDSGGGGTIWETVTWNTEAQGSVPAGASIAGRVRAANNVGDLPSAPWVAVSSGVLIAGVTGQFIELEMKLTAGDDGATPVLSDVRVVGRSPNSPPDAVCQNVTINAVAGMCSATASVDGGSSDPDGDALMTTFVPPGPYPVGTTPVTMTVTDPSGASSSCSANVVVVDNQAPSIVSVTPSVSTLWEPNHTMHPISVAASASDNCGGQLPASACVITAVTSNEAINSQGDGNTDPDWNITGPTTVELRAERKGNGTGRIYTITVECTDAAGNKTQGTTTVNVPHNQ